MINFQLANLIREIYAQDYQEGITKGNFNDITTNHNRLAKYTRRGWNDYNFALVLNALKDKCLCYFNKPTKYIYI